MKRLVGGVVHTISFGKYIIHIFFDGGNQLSFESPFCFGAADSIDSAPVNRFPLSESGYANPGKSQSAIAGCDDDGTLILNFSNGDVLAIYANDPRYEAYTLLLNGDEYIV